MQSQLVRTEYWGLYFHRWVCESCCNRPPLSHVHAYSHLISYHIIAILWNVDFRSWLCTVWNDGDVMFSFLLSVVFSKWWPVRLHYSAEIGTLYGCCCRHTVVLVFVKKRRRGFDWFGVSKLVPTLFFYFICLLTRAMDWNVSIKKFIWIDAENYILNFVADDLCHAWCKCYNTIIIFKSRCIFWTLIVFCKLIWLSLSHFRGDPK